MKRTKQIILVSVVAIVLSVVACLGVTYAFFVSEATNRGNVIQSGRLDYDLQLLNGSTMEWGSIKGNPTLGFTSNTWAPNTTEVQTLKIENSGELMLQWQARFVFENEIPQLAEVIEVSVRMDSTEPTAMLTDVLGDGWTNVGTLDTFAYQLSAFFNGNLEANECLYLSIAFSIKEDATYDQTLKLGKIGIEISIAQDHFENDFFGSDYDPEPNFGCSHATIETTEGKAATCTENGYTASKKCTVCQEVLLESKIIPTNGSHTAGPAATCTTAQTCTECGIELAPKLGHTEVIDAAVAATCTATGLTEGKHCSVCSEVLVAQTVTEKLGHTAGEPVKENIVNPVLNANGTVTNGSYDSVVYCSACNAEISREEVEIQVTDLTVTAEKRNLVGFTGAVDENLVIPGFFKATDGNWYKTIAIDSKAFYECTNLAKVTIPNTVTSIGAEAFRFCVSLTSIVIPNSVTSIGSFAFRECTKLSNVAIPTGVAALNEGVFQYCTGLTGITIPDNVTEIHNSAFNGCTSLENVTISKNVTTIGIQAFYNCTALTSITFNGTVDKWGTITFVENNNNWNLEVPATHVKCTDGYVHFRNYAGETAIDAAVAATCTATGLTEGSHCTVCGKVLVTQTAVAALGHDYNCTYESVPNSSTVVLIYTCSRCPDSYTQTIDGVEDITLSSENRAKAGYTGVANESFKIPGVFWDEDDQKWYRVVAIGNQAFKDCSNLKTVTIPNTVTSIGASAFLNCTSLTSITIPEGITVIDNYTFKNCTSLSSVTIPNSVTTIGSYAFDSCEILSEIVLPSSITKIDAQAFQTCKNLANIQFNGTVAQWETITLGTGWNKEVNVQYVQCTDGKICIKEHILGAAATCTTAQTCTVCNFEKVAALGHTWVDATCTVPKTCSVCGATEGSALGHNYVQTYESDPSSTTVTINYTCSRCGHTYSETVTVEDLTVTTSNRAKVGYTGAANESLEIPGVFYYENDQKWYRVIAIGDNAFKGCANLASLTLPNTVTTIGENSFWNCTSLASLTIPESLTSIGLKAFYDCSPVNVYVTDIAAWLNMDIDNHLWSNPNYDNKTTLHFVDANGNEITELTIPEGITSIRSYAFAGVTELTDITFEGTVEQWKAITLGTSWNKNVNVQYVQCSNGKICIKEHIPGAAATCTTAQTCTVCGEELAPKLAHTAGEWTVVTAATYTQEGLQQKKCTVCSTVLKEEAIPKPSPFKFSDNGDGTLTITGFKQEVIDQGLVANFADLVIPSTYEGQPVTAIGGFAFSAIDSDQTQNLKSVIIPEGVTKIGYSSFNRCTGLTSITIPKSVTTIDIGAFYGCSALETVYIADLTAWCNIDFTDNGTHTCNPLRFAGKLYLNGEQITNLIIPNDVTEIKPYTFVGYDGSSVIIHDNITGIGNSAFASCKNLTSIVIGKNVKSIGDYALSGCSALTSITIPDGVTSLGKGAIKNCSSLLSIEIPASVTSIGAEAFMYCTALNTITFKGTVEQWNVVTKGNNWYFQIPAQYVQCSNGKVCIKPHIAGAAATCTTAQTCTECGEELAPKLAHTAGAAATCTTAQTCTACGEVLTAALGHMEVTVSGYDPKSNSDQAYGKTDGKQCSVCGVWTVPQEKVYWGVAAKSNLEKLGIYTGAENETVEIPQYYRLDGKLYKTMMIGSFSNCTNLAHVVIPEGVKGINVNSAFSGCTGLESITIPSTFTQSTTTAFSDCTNLKAVYITDLSAWCNISFVNTLASNPLYYGAKLYLNGELVTDLVIPSDVTTIGDRAFSGCTSLTSITISDGVEVIGNYAFGSCTNITDVTIADSVTEIDAYAFIGCTNLESVVIGSGVTQINVKAFLDCTALTNVIFKNPNGWWYATSSNATSGTAITRYNLSDPSSAAKGLKSSSAGGNGYYYWFRTEETAS